MPISRTRRTISFRLVVCPRRALYGSDSVNKPMPWKILVLKFMNFTLVADTIRGFTAYAFPRAAQYAVHEADEPTFRRDWLRKCTDFVCVVCCWSRSVLLIALCGLVLSACMHAAPAMLNERTAVISGRETMGNSANEAIRRMLTKAAAMTLDHGFRYFQIVNSRSTYLNHDRVLPIRPGVDVTIKLYREGEISPRRPGVWDADKIAAGDMGNVAALSAGDATTPLAPRSRTLVPAKPNISPLSCPDYGCTW